MSDITDAGGTALTPGGGGAGGGGLISKFIALGGAAQSAAKGITSLADAEKILADAQKQLTKDTEALHVTTNAYAQSASDVNTSMVKTTADAAAWGASMANQSKITGQAIIDNSGLSKSLHDAATEALASADAFGNLASKFGDVSAAADHATDGLVGVAWEMRSATKETVTLNDSQNALVESLAKVSDQYGKTSLWVEHLLSQFEKGTVSLADFRQELADMLIGMRQLPDMFGDTSVQMNIMLALLDKFKNTASNGWPVTTTTAPYSNPSNPVTGKP